MQFWSLPTEIWYGKRSLILCFILKIGQKIKALTRPTSSHQAPGSSVARQPRNLDPALHPFERAREYSRALNATKIERMFAKPFVGDLGKGHVDGVYVLSKDPERLDVLASGSGDGVVKTWDLTSRQETFKADGHEGIVKGLCWTKDQKLLSCASDKTIKLFDPSNKVSGSASLGTYLGTTAFTGISHHRSLPNFAASSSAISIYDLSRSTSTPLQTLSWPTSTNTINALSWNQTETSVLASCATDRSIILYDLRTSSPLSKVTLGLASNAIAWNPMEAFNFAVANEDHNIYSKALFALRIAVRGRFLSRDPICRSRCSSLSLL